MLFKAKTYAYSFVIIGLKLFFEFPSDFEPYLASL